MNTYSWIALTNTALLICEASRTGICAINWQPFPVWRKSRVSAGSYGSTKSISIPNKLLAYGIPLSTVIDRVKSSTNEVGGKSARTEWNAIHGSRPGLSEVAGRLGKRARHGKERNTRTDQGLGHVSFGPDIREGVAEWNGEGETVGGIVVMRYGLKLST